MNQASLLTVTVADVINSPFPSADMKQLAIGDDGHDYALKPPLPHYPEHAAGEALAYHLAQSCGVAVPVPVVLDLRDGTKAFGCRFEGGVTQYTQMDPAERLDALVSCAPWLSALCALDLFLGNDDRHADNGLYRRSIVDGRWTFLAMDFSRAWWHGNFPAAPISHIASTGNTATFVRLLRAYNAWDRGRAGTVAASLLSITTATLTGWIDDLPQAWRTERVEALPNWWASDDRAARITELSLLL